MNAFELADILPILPESYICLSAIVLLLSGVFGSERSGSFYHVLAVIVMAAGLSLLVHYYLPGRMVALGGMVVVDGFTQFVKGMLLVGGVLVVSVSSDWLQRDSNTRFEFSILLLLAVTGLMLMVSANNLISMYMGLELASLSLYVMAAIDRDNPRAAEAGIKYFVLGSLASGMLLFGSSLIYGFSGTTDFAQLALLLQPDATGHISLLQSPGIIVGLVMVIAALCFKVSAVPFHMWTPDVYEGAPTPVTAFFSVAPKVAALALFARLLLQPFGGMFEHWQQIIIFVSVASMVVGALGAIMQSNIKRLLAYSSIGHVGYALIGLAAGTVAGVQGMLIYLALYMVMSAGMFGCVMLMRRGGVYVENISELGGLSRTHPRMALLITVFMLSMAGIPPLAGFFGKLYIFLAAVESGLMALAVIGVVASVVGCFYYLRVIKIMFFDEVHDKFDAQPSSGLRLALLLCGVITFPLFAFIPTPLVESALWAARALLL